MKKKALVVGINNYLGSPLNGCVNDAEIIAGLLERNQDDSINFDVKRMIDIQKKDDLRASIEKLFSGDDDIALLYFSGHGMSKSDGEYLCTPNGTNSYPGIKLSDITDFVIKSKCKNKIIILDCCFAGGMCNSPLNVDCSVLPKGVTILSACKNNESSIERNGHGLFTTLLSDALNGGAADLCGHITLGAIYAYVDKALGAWDPRPVFKTHVQEFISLRDVNPPINNSDLKELKNLFKESNDLLNLDPSFEFTNNPKITVTCVMPYAIDRNVKTLKLLQRLEGIGLVVPDGEEHMYFAAMKSKSCKLTPLGQYYHMLVKTGKL